MTTVIPNVFVAGTKAKAEEVNENFEVLAEAVNKQHENIQALVDNSLEELENTKEEILAEINETQVGNMAHLTLDNLDEEGKSVIISQSQHKPFSISNGAVDENGRNRTLHKLAEDIKVNRDYRFTSQKASYSSLSARMFRDDEYAKYLPLSFSISNSSSAPNILTLFNKSDISTNTTLSNLPFAITFYNPTAIRVKKFKVTNSNNSNDKSLKEYEIYGSNDYSVFTLLKSGTNENNEIGQTWEINLSDNFEFYKLYKIKVISAFEGGEVEINNIDIIAEYQYTYGTNNSFICEPCTITTADGRTKIFEDSIIGELGSDFIVSSPIYIFKSFTSGDITKFAKYCIGKAEPPKKINNFQKIGNPTEDKYYSNAYRDFDTNNYITALDLKGFNPGPNEWTLYGKIAMSDTYSQLDIIQTVVCGVSGNSLSFKLQRLKNNILKFIAYDSTNNKEIVSLSSTALNSDSYNFEIRYQFDEEGLGKYKFIVNSGSTIVADLESSNNLKNIAPIRKLVFGVDYDYKTDKCATAVNAYKDLIYISMFRLGLASNRTYWQPTQNIGLWLDTSSVPYTLKRNKNGLSWEVDNDSVYLGYVQLGLDDIEAIGNVEFDKDYSSNAREVIETFDYKTSGYRIYSDGYCEQWGRFLTPALANNAVTLLKTMRDTDYQIFLQDVGGVGGTNTTILSSTEDGFVFYISRNGSSAVCTETKWRVCGYLAEDQY